MASKKESAKKAKGHGSFYLWGGLGVVILVLGVAMSIVYIQRVNLPPENRLRIIQDFVGRFSGKMDQTIGKIPGVGTMMDRLRPGEPPPQRRVRSGVYTHQVRAGENLWRIAKSGELVDTPWEWPTIFAQNRDKMDYAFMSAETGAWKVLLEPGQELSVTSGMANNAALENLPRKYAVQMLSLEEEKLGRAVQIVGALLKGGRFAYMYRMEVEGKNWYRIRVGFFEDAKTAMGTANSIKQQFRKTGWFTQQPWVLKPLMEEMRGERLEFGAQHVSPFVIELQARNTHAEALDDLRKIAGVRDFVYLNQARDEVSENFRYRARVGYYPTEEQARQVIVDQQQADGPLWAGARVVEVRKFAEAIPGQNFNLFNPAKQP